MDTHKDKLNLSVGHSQRKVESICHHFGFELFHMLFRSSELRNFIRKLTFESRQLCL